MLLLSVIEIREYIDARGNRTFENWFNRLNAPAAAKVTIALARVEQGNLANCKSVKAGVSELRIDFGPGYRVYFGKDGERFVILLGGGTKKRQQKDILKAQDLWKEYKKRKKQEIRK